METVSPQDRIAQQNRYWSQQEKHCKQQLKAWKEAETAQAKGDLSRLRKLLSQLQEDPENPAREALQSWVQSEERQRPLRLGKQLREAAEAAGVSAQQVGESPPTWRLDPLEIELDFPRGQAILRYARQELSRVPLDSATIVGERERMLRSLDTQDFVPEEYVARLHEAYRRCLSSARLRWGERVELVDVLPELAFLLQSEKFRKDPAREAFKPYGKVRFAFDLARLRRSRQLEHQGARLSLGTATLGTTRNKDRVMYLEEAGQGQYYLSLAFQGGQP